MASILDKQEVNRARIGPRELKDPRSKEYAIQTLYALKRYAESLRCDEERVAKELDEIERYRHWEVLGYPSKSALLEAEVSALGLENIAALRRPGAQEGNDNRAKVRENKPTNVRFEYGNRSAYTLARLKRDRPDLAQQVIDGTLTANAAAILAGFRRKMWSAPDDAELLALAIAKRYPGWRMIRDAG